VTAFVIAAANPVAARLAGGGLRKSADAGKPDCYGVCGACYCRSALAREGVLKIAPAGKPDCYGCG